MLLSKETARQIANPEPTTIEKVPGLEYGVRIRSLGALEALDYSSGIGEETAESGLKAMVDLIILTVVDEDGNRVFGPDDFDLVAGFPFRTIRFLSSEAASINGMALEEAEGN